MSGGRKRNDQEGERTMETRTLKKARQAIDLMTNTMLREGSILSLLGPEFDGPSDADLRSIFRVFDRDHDGFISGTEIGAVLETLGRKPDDQKIESLLAKCDPGKTGKIPLQAFLDYFEEKVEEKRLASAPPKPAAAASSSSSSSSSTASASKKQKKTSKKAAKTKAAPAATPKTPKKAPAKSILKPATTTTTTTTTTTAWGASSWGSSSSSSSSSSSAYSAPVYQAPVVTVPVVTQQLQNSEGIVVAVVPAGEAGEDDVEISANNVLLKVSFVMPKEQRKVVFVCDTSGSMNGTPRQRVEAVVDEMLRAGYDFDIINYSNSAVLLQSQPGSTVLQQLRQTWASGCTNFCRAFERMRQVLQDPANDAASLDFVFLTDGEPSDGPLSTTSYHGVTLPQLREDIVARMRRTGKKTVIHSFGLGRSAHCDLLEQLRVSGNVAGMFSYAAPADSNASAELATLMSFATTSKSLPVFIDGDDTIAHTTAFTVNDKSGQLEGELWVGSEPAKIVVQATDALRLEMTNVVQQQGDLDYELARLRRDIYLCKKMDHVANVEQRLKQLRANHAAAAGAELDDLENELDQVRTIITEQSSSSKQTSADADARSRAMPFREQMSRVRRERVVRTEVIV